MFDLFFNNIGAYADFIGLDDDTISAIKEAGKKMQEKWAEQEKQKKTALEQELASYPIQLIPFRLSEKDMKKYNIRDCQQMQNWYFLKEGDAISLSAYRIPEKVDFLRAINGKTDKKYVVVWKLVADKFTKEERKKYDYLTGNYRYNDYYCVIDIENLKEKWVSDKRFDDTPYIYNRVMSHKGKYIYLPTMETLYEKSYSGEVIHTKKHIIIAESRWDKDKSATMIDNETGEISMIE